MRKEKKEDRQDRGEAGKRKGRVGLQASDPDGQLGLSWDVESQMQRLSLVASAEAERKSVLPWLLPPSSGPPQDPSCKLHLGLVGRVPSEP